MYEVYDILYPMQLLQPYHTIQAWNNFIESDEG